MNLHKERIAQLRELRAAVGKPMYNPQSLSPKGTTKGGHHQENHQQYSEHHDKNLIRTAQEVLQHDAKTSVHQKARYLLQSDDLSPTLNSSASSTQAIPSSQIQTVSHNSLDKSSNSKDPVHRKLQATVQLLSESLEEQGHLRALLELTAHPHRFDALLVHLAHPADDVLQDIKVRALRSEKEKLLSQMIDMRAQLEDERAKVHSLETDLSVARELLQNCETELDRSEAEAERWRRRAQAVPGPGAGVGQCRPTTPPASRRTANSMLFAPASQGPASRNALDSYGPLAPLSPDVSLGHASDYPLPSDDEEEVDEENEDALEREVREDDEDSGSLVLLELDAVDDELRRSARHVHYEDEDEATAASDSPRGGTTSGMRVSGSSRSGGGSGAGAVPEFEDSDLEGSTGSPEDSPRGEDQALSLSARESIYIDYDELPSSTSPLAAFPASTSEDQNAQPIEDDDSPVTPKQPRDSQGVCVLLDIDLGNDQSDQIVINTDENPMFLAYAFMQKHGLADSLFQPLCEYIKTTQDELIASNVAQDKNNQDVGTTPGGSSQASGSSPLQMESISLSPEKEVLLEEEDQDNSLWEHEDVVGSVTSKLTSSTMTTQPVNILSSSGISQLNARIGDESFGVDDNSLLTNSTLSNSRGESRFYETNGFSSRASSDSRSSQHKRVDEHVSALEEIDEFAPPLPEDEPVSEDGELEDGNVLDDMEMDLDAVELHPFAHRRLPYSPSAASGESMSSPAPSSRMRAISSPMSPSKSFTFPVDKSLDVEDIGEIVSIAAGVMQRAHDLQREGRMQHALPLYEHALKLFELTNCAEAAAVRDLLSDTLL